MLSNGLEEFDPVALDVIGILIRISECADDPISARFSCLTLAWLRAYVAAHKECGAGATSLYGNVPGETHTPYVYRGPPLIFEDAIAERG